MSFLSLSRGDPAARALLQRAIRARYGPRPPGLDSLRVWLSARDKGPLGLPARLNVEEQYVGLNQWQWAETKQVFGISIRKIVQKYVGSADGSTGTYTLTVRNAERKLDDPDTVASYRRRIWAMRAAYLTPLTQEGVTLTSVSATAFSAANDKFPDDGAVVTLNPDDTVASVETIRQGSPFIIRFEGGLQTLNDLVLPKRIIYEWRAKDAGPVVYTVLRAEANPSATVM